MPTLSASCEITVVDFSQDQLNLQTFDNETLGPFLKLKQPQWVKCRWINVNGLSWDVIKLLGRHKNLHKLAIEDIMNIRNRTKAEWYVQSTIEMEPGGRVTQPAGFRRMLSSS
jgi:Mg2+ and Co2+ transporter CorA